MSSPLHFSASAQRPVLVLGLIGFTSQERHRIQSQLEIAPVGGVQWRIGNFADANGWLASGERTRVIADDEVVVDAGDADAKPVRLWLPQVDRPIAFSRPFASSEFDPAVSFELNSNTSLLIVLAKLSQWLRPQAMLLYLADLLVQNAGRMRKSRVYHLMQQWRLIGVVDLQGHIGVLPEATLGDIAGASWLPRPDSASYVPENFARRGTRELLWEFAGRSERDLLPARYREMPIALRKAPLVAQRLMSDAHLFVLRELAQAPRTFAQLCTSAPLPASEIARALAAMYLVGAITSLTESANALLSRDGEASRWPWWQSSQGQGVSVAQDFTVPAALPAR